MIYQNILKIKIKTDIDLLVIASHATFRGKSYMNFHRNIEEHPSFHGKVHPTEEL